jgi:long-subunit fatty acid transport protein
MKPVILNLALTVGLSSTVNAQTFDFINAWLYEPMLNSEVMHNARSMALGGATAATVHDGSALWYNPAALVRIPRPEFLGGLGRGQHDGASLSLSVDPAAPPPRVSPTQESMTSPQGGALYFSFPFPTYRGALTVSAGMAITHDLSRILAAELRFAPGTFVDTLDPTPGSFVAEQIEYFDFNERQEGRVRSYQLGVGMAVSPRISLGITGIYYDGEVELANETVFSGTRFEAGNFPVPVSWQMVTITSEKIRGGGAHFGVLWHARNNIGLGAVIKSPAVLTIESTQFGMEQRDSGAVFHYEDPAFEREIELPASLVLGGTWRLGQFMLAADAGYTDWTTLKTNVSSTPSTFRQEIRRSYREAVSVGGGLEWVIPSISTSLRAGIRWAQLPYDEQFVVDDQLTWSGGLGFLVQRSLAFDLGVSYETSRGGNPLYGFDEDYSKWTVLLTAAFRPASFLSW